MQDYMIKKMPEDFVVKEITSLQFHQTKDRYLIYKLKKVNRNTEDCVQFVSKKFKIPRKFIGFAGAKDRNAITEQYISIMDKQNIEKRIENAKEAFENFSLNFIGYSNNPISLGDLKENRFEITIRNINKEFEIKKPYFIVNYYDEQRFSKNNKEIGKALLKKDFKQVVILLKEQNKIDDEMINLYKEDYIKIIRHTPLKILKLFVHSYQSFLFNELCKQILIKEKYSFVEIDYSQGKLFFALNEPKNKELPILGFGSEIEEKYVSIIDELLEKEKIDLREFIIKQIPEVSSFGTQRKFITNISDFSNEEFLDDELNLNKKKVKIKFSLGKGSYATLVVKKIMSMH